MIKRYEFLSNCCCSWAGCEVEMSETLLKLWLAIEGSSLIFLCFQNEDLENLRFCKANVEMWFNSWIIIKDIYNQLRKRKHIFSFELKIG